MESAAPSYGTPTPRTMPPSNPSLDDTLESVLNNYVKTLLDAVRDLSDTVKQTRLSDYLINPAGLVDNPVLRSIIDAHLKTLRPLPAVTSFVWDLSSVPPAVRSSPGFQFLFTMGCKYWPPRCNAIPKDPSLPDLTNIGEPANVRDLQMVLPSMGHVGNFENLRGFVQSFFEIWQKNGCRGYASTTIPIPLVCGGPGTGKTHFCRMAIRKFLDNDIEAGDDDPFKIACAFSAQKNLHIELSFRDGLIDGETACPEGSLCLRIAYEIFKGFTPFRCQYPTSHEFLSAFLSGSSSPASHLSLLDLRYFLRARLALASNDTIIFVHLDEIERIFEGSNKQESIAYFQGILDSFEDFNQWRSRVVFCTLFSGTGPAPIVAAIKTWECCCGCPFLINLDPITPKEYCQGLSDFLSMQIGHDSKPPPFKASEISKGVQGTLMDIEGVPKLFIALLHVLSCLKGPQFVSPPSAQFLDWSINRQRIRDAVEDSSLSTSTILKALHTCITDSNILPSWIASDDANISMIWCYTITDTPTSPESRLDGRNEDSPTFSELEHDGKVVLRRLPLYVQGRGFHRDSGPLYWQEVEEFDGTWLLCRLKAFQDEKWPSQPLQDFLSMESSCRQADSLISLSGPIDDSLEQLETKPHDMVNKCRRLGKTGCFGWKNVLGVGGWDWALSLPLVDAGRLLLVGKRMEGSLHPSRIEAELKKATATWFRTGMRVGHFVVLTDGVFEGTLSANVKKMASIVDRTTMDKFFGKIMAARLQAVSDFRASV
ncbi:uncharacterized protein EV420DRAFT_1569767 [Desarmillaria tabescens]|uniref:Uncharacterized protein n=1 Tax=Armillaria tabescens TaxID=1929756 RepID=A0AA39MTY6_ARMTA|nr:uncharacterized protein EV420DRAFT_1569767 [Desarmillaria tabescens]KAK0446522.1 hypothetical protein EV420DRAFT_1569767 [Desarmillaria tabescens]